MLPIFYPSIRSGGFSIRLMNAEKFMERSKEQDEMMVDREESGRKF